MSLCTLKCAPYSYPAYSNGQLYCARDLTYYSRLNIATGSAYKSKCLPDMSMGGYCSGAATSVFTYYMDTCTTASLPSSGDYDCCFNNANTEESISYITDKDATVVWSLILIYCFLIHSILIHQCFLLFLSLIYWPIYLLFLIVRLYILIIDECKSRSEGASLQPEINRPQLQIMRRYGRQHDSPLWRRWPRKWQA